MKIMLLSLFFTCTLYAQDYPAQWWAPVPPSEAASWEVLPQEAGPGEVILSKRNELGIFSNFSRTPFVFDGISYQSLEGFWHMMKYPENASDERARFPGIKWKYTREQVAQMTSFEAKAAGDLASANMKIMGMNWVSYQNKKMTYHTSEKGDHYNLIKSAMWAKLVQNPGVKTLLLKTGNLILRADHKVSPTDPPAWKYYEIYMEFRNKIQHEN